MDRQVLFDALDDENSWKILAYTSERALSAQELAERLETSRPTVYRRLEDLMDYDLVSERIRLNTTGNHSKEYTSNLKELEVRIENEELHIDAKRHEDTVDRFTRMWEGIRGDR